MPYSTNIVHARFVRRALLAGICAVMWVIPLPAEAVKSTNFQIQEDFVGGSGGANASSPSYKAQDVIGAPAAGPAAGTIYKTQSGSPTTPDPTLTMSVDTSSVNLGSLSTSLTRTGTATFSVLNYTSYGYIVQILGNPPDNGGHTLVNMSSAGSSTIGTEQFGINLKANTSPATFGADPQQIPNSSFGFGAAASGYNTTNTYKYVSGSTIASAPKSSGKTTYTISYIVNVSNNTAGGSYSGKPTLVVTGTY